MCNYNIYGIIQGSFIIGVIELAVGVKQIKNDLENHLGKRIRLKANRGRRKTITREGFVERTYPHIFTVRLDQAKSRIPRVSYSYIDILTSNIEFEYLE